MEILKAPAEHRIIEGKRIAGNDSLEGLLVPNIEYAYVFENGMRTDTIDSIIYTIVFPKNKYKAYPIKVKGDKAIITNEQLIQKQEIKVRCVNLSGRLYYSEKIKDIAESCTADSVEVIS